MGVDPQLSFRPHCRTLVRGTRRLSQAAHPASVLERGSVGRYPRSAAPGLSAHSAQPILDTDVSNDGKIAYVAQDAAHPEDIWIFGGSTRVPSRVTAINPQFEKVSLGTSRTISWRSVDGFELHGALLLPGNYKEGARYPLIVNVYGGADLSDVVNRFGFGGDAADNMQIFATRGFAVLFRDSPLRKGTPMQDLLETVLPGVNRVVELGIADPDRLGIMGHSYGGYSTLALIVQSRIFKAAVDSAGVASPANMWQ